MIIFYYSGCGGVDKSVLTFLVHVYYFSCYFHLIFPLKFPQAAATTA